MDVWNFKVTQAIKNLNDFVLDAKGMVNSAYTLDEYNKIFAGLEVGMGYNSQSGGSRNPTTYIYIGVKMLNGKIPVHCRMVVPRSYLTFAHTLTTTQMGFLAAHNTALY